MGVDSSMDEAKTEMDEGTPSRGNDCRWAQRFSCRREGNNQMIFKKLGSYLNELWYNHLMKHRRPKSWVLSI